MTSSQVATATGMGADLPGRVARHSGRAGADLPCSVITGRIASTMGGKGMTSYMDTPAGAALVRAAQEGDRRALEALVAEYLPLVYNVVGRALGGHADVDDVVQETMLRAVQGLPRLREPERFRAWLVSIAIRQVQDRGRGLTRNPGLGFDRRVAGDAGAAAAGPGPR